MNTGDLVADRYRLVRPIGRGAMGTVWAARHEMLGREFALKFAVLPAQKAPEARERFLREAQIVGKLRHPNIVDVADFGEVSPSNTLYLAMELLAGESLASRIEREGKLDPVEALAITLEITRGLAAAHAAGIVHYDIKPENIFLSNSPTGAVVPKLLDFGISKRQGEQALRSIDGQPVGTPAYMSPEQALGELDVDHRTDLWSLGVVLYEMLTGKHPFVAPNYQALMTRIAEEPALPFDDDVPPAAREIVSRCLAKLPSERYPTAEALGDALDGALAKLRRKRPTSTGIIGAVLVLLSLVLLALVLRSSRSRDEGTNPPQPEAPTAATPALSSLPGASPSAPPALAQPEPSPNTPTSSVNASPTPTSTAPSSSSSSTAKPPPSTGKKPTTSINDPGF